MSQHASHLLIDDSPLQVLPTLAVVIGLHEAIALQQLHWRLQRSRNVFAGIPWEFDTYEAWQAKHFPFWCVRTVKRIFAKLCGDGLVISRKDLNAHAYDTTCWYTIDYAKLAQLDGLQGLVPQRSASLSTGVEPKGHNGPDETERLQDPEKTPGKDVSPTPEDLPPAPAAALPVEAAQPEQQGPAGEEEAQDTDATQAACAAAGSPVPAPTGSSPAGAGEGPPVPPGGASPGRADAAVASYTLIWSEPQEVARRWKEKGALLWLHSAPRLAEAMGLVYHGAREDDVNLTLQEIADG